MFTYVEDKDLLKVNDGNSWRGPARIEGRAERRYICQTECILMEFRFEEQPADTKSVVQGFSSKKDRDSEELYNQYISKYIKCQPQDDHNN